MEKHKILIVDDDQVIRDSLLQALKASGFEADAANDGVDGLAKAASMKPDLIVTDVEMPHMDGMTLLKELRNSSEWGKKVPVIILTNYDTNENTFQGVVEHEPSFYLLKSNVDPEIIIEKIKESLSAVPPSV